MRHSFIIILLSFVSSYQLLALEVHGHRGARARFPENTLPAFQYALTLGVDVLEMDLAVTKDKVLVISHDPEINSELCLAASGKPIEKGLLIHKLTLAEVRTFDCGSIQNRKFPEQKTIPGTKIPTLDEVFQMVESSNLQNSKSIRFNIETKIDSKKPDQTVGPDEFSELLMGVVKQHGLLTRVIVQSFDYRTLKAVRLIDPGVKIAALTDNPTEDLSRTAQELKADVISPMATLLNPFRVWRIHRTGAIVIPWTPNSYWAWKLLIWMGVDGIITDDPEPLLKLLGR